MKLDGLNFYPLKCFLNNCLLSLKSCEKTLKCCSQTLTEVNHFLHAFYFLQCLPLNFERSGSVMEQLFFFEGVAL